MDAASYQPVALDNAAAEGLICPACGYSLRGIASDRCPECGLAIDRSALAVSRIPWVHRRRIGPVRAYWRTVWFSTFQRKKLAGEVSRSVSYSDAQRFRWVTVTIMMLPAVIAWPFFPAPAVKELTAALALPDPMSRWMIPLLLLGCTLPLLAITGTPSYFFHPRMLSVPQQNRAIALSYYACAPLAPAAILLYVLVALSFASSIVSERFFHAYGTLIMGLLSVLPCAAFVLLMYFLFNTSALLKRVTRAGLLRQGILVLSIAGSIVLLGPAITIGLPWIAGHVYWLARE